MAEPLIIQTAPHSSSASHHEDDIHSYFVHTYDGEYWDTRHSLDIHTRFDQVNIHQHSLSEQEETSLVPPSTVEASLSASGRTPARSRQHSLRSITTNLYNEMTTFVPEAPGSPPGLTGSKSSKSSSYHSSSFTGAEGILSDITHFEDIGLEEEQPFYQNLHGMEKMRLPPQSAATTASGPRGSAAATTSTRELTTAGKKPTYPRTQGLGISNGNGMTHALALPNGGGYRRGIRSPSTPSLAIKAMSNYNRSRSPSPDPTTSLQPKATANPGSPRRPGLVPLPTETSPMRRGSWQPSRKTIQELEAEYNDSDEDLPDDASLWNVPLSPRPPEERAPMSATYSLRASPTTSPERPSQLRTSLGVNVHQAPKTAPVNGGMSTTQSVSPKRPPVRGASTGTLPDRFAFSNRTKSWNVVLSELSEEAKTLTEALENFAMAAERKHEEAVQNGGVVAEPEIGKVSRTKSSTVGLPPLRMNNVMIDPLPISKEKEKVLSRTRPSWLPPKSQKEEKKHLKEYQRMMEFSLEAERREAAKMADNQCAKDDSKSALLRIWEEHVLPNWEQVIREPRTRELWWRGVAPKSRIHVWLKAIGNDLTLTEITYSKALQRAKTIDFKLAKGSSDEHRKEKAWFDAIRRDVKVTFPELNIFQPGGPFHEDLVDVLMAYSMYRSDVGYSHGTHLIAAFLTLTMPNPATIFLTLSNLLNRPLPLAFLTGDPAATSRAYTLTLSLLAHKSPRLHTHLFTPSGLNLSPAEILEPMMRTLFLGPGGGLGVDVAARVWDVMVFDGDAVVVRTAVGVLGALEGLLYVGRDEVRKVLGWSRERRSWDVGGEEAFLQRVRWVGKQERGT